jgi:hypothetical protein
MDIVTYALIGYILGAIGRTVFDFLLKKLQNDDMTFDPKFYATMIISIILTMIVSAFTFPISQVFGSDPASVLIAAGSQGFAINHIVNSLVTLQGKMANPPS